MTAGVGEPKAGAARGLLASLSQLARSLVSTLQSRAELLSLELALERARLVRMVVLAVVALFFLALAAIAATIFVIVLFWDTHRLLAIGLIALGYLVLAAWLAAAAKRELTQAARPFAATIAELKKDRDRLMSR